MENNSSVIDFTNYLNSSGSFKPSSKFSAVEYVDKDPTFTLNKKIKELIKLHAPNVQFKFTNSFLVCNTYIISNINGNTLSFNELNNIVIGDDGYYYNKEKFAPFTNYMPPWKIKQINTTVFNNFRNYILNYKEETVQTIEETSDSKSANTILSLDDEYFNYFGKKRDLYRLNFTPLVIELCKKYKFKIQKNTGAFQVYQIHSDILFNWSDNEDGQFKFVENSFFANTLQAFSYGPVQTRSNISQLLERIDDQLLLYYSISNDKTYKYRLSKIQVEFFKDFQKLFNSSLDEINSNEIMAEKKFRKDKESALLIFDQNNNGILDLVEANNDYMNLVSKYQSKIINTNREYIQDFIKVNEYLDANRSKLQLLFDSLQNSNDKSQLSNRNAALNNAIEAYNLFMFHAFNMVISLTQDDLITFYEIYQKFDKLNVFNSNHENVIQNSLHNIEFKLDEMIDAIERVGDQIVNEIGNMNYVTQQSIENLEATLSHELENINSTVRANNLLQCVQIYQSYSLNKKINKLK